MSHVSHQNRQIRKNIRRAAAALALMLFSSVLVTDVALAQDPPAEYVGGQVNCDNERGDNDALAIAEYGIGLRGDGGECPLADPDVELNAGAGDVNLDGTTDILDALLIAQCNAGLQAEVCDPLPPPPPPTALTGTEEGFVIATESGNCVEVVDRSTEAGAAIHFESCGNPSPHEVWVAVEVEPLIYQLENPGSSYCLSVDGDQAGAPLVLWPCEGQPSQRFTIQGTTLRPQHTGQCLDGANDSTLAASIVVQQPCDGSASQNFVVEAGTLPPAGRPRDGFWGPSIGTPLVPVAGANLPDGRVLMWSAYKNGSFAYPGDPGYTQTAIFDPVTNQSSAREVSNTGHDMFCPGIVNLPDGRILVNGGSSAAATSIYDPLTDQWIDGEDMNVTRGYNASAVLSNGDVFTLGGSWSGGIGGKLGEVWSPGNGWRSLPNVPSERIETRDEGTDKRDNHTWLFSAENGRVFHAGPSSWMHWIDTAGQGSMSYAGERGNDSHAMAGNAVMYAPDKILTNGGAQNQDTGRPTANMHVIEIDGPDPVVRQVESMDFPRIFQSSVVLPTGEVLIVGGQSVVRKFTDDEAVLTAEMFDPVGETVRQVASMSVPRTYHSIAMLLTDGRVLAGGGGLCGDCEGNHYDVQIYTPPYLFDDEGGLAARPTITSAPQFVGYGSTVNIETDSEIAEFSFVRMSSATHAVNNEQRRIPAEATGANGSYQVAAPATPGTAPPGLYMLFAIDTNGVPSESVIVQVG